MSNTTAIAIRPADTVAEIGRAPTAERHAGTLLEFITRPADSFRGLLDAGTLAVIVDEVRAMLATPPAEELEARAEVMTLIGSFPRRPDEPAIYCAALAKEAERWPADVVREARRTIVRTLRFLPTVAELAEVCAAIQGRRRLLMMAAERMERERRRREAEESRRAMIEAQRQARRIAHHAVLHNQFGELAIGEGDFDDAAAACRFASSSTTGVDHADFVIWSRAYQDAAPWAVAVARRAAVIGRALRLQSVGAFSLDIVSAVTTGVMHGDLEGARRMLDQAEAGALPQFDRPTATRDTLRSQVGEALDRDACEAEAASFQSRRAA